MPHSRDVSIDVTYHMCLFTLHVTMSELASVLIVIAHLLSLWTWDHWTGTLLTLKQNHPIMRNRQHQTDVTQPSSKQAYLPSLLVTLATLVFPE